MYSFLDLEPVCCSMFCSNCCFFTYIQVSQEVGKVVWYSHPFKNFPQFVVIHTVKGFGVVNEAEFSIFWNTLALPVIQQILTILSLVHLAFFYLAWTSESSWFLCCWSLENFEHYFGSVWDECSWKDCNDYNDQRLLWFL